MPRCIAEADLVQVSFEPGLVRSTVRLDGGDHRDLQSRDTARTSREMDSTFSRVSLALMCAVIR